MYQVINVAGIWFGEICSCFHDDMGDAKEDGVVFLDGWVLDYVGYKLTGEASVQTCVGLVVWVFLVSRRLSRRWVSTPPSHMPEK